MATRTVATEVIAPTRWSVESTIRFKFKAMQHSCRIVLIFAIGCLFIARPSTNATDDKPKGHELAVSTGKQFPELKPFDELMEAFVRDNEIPGASLAVAKDGRLVYARGFGYADVEQQQPVRPNSLFRIASISKTFTSVATLQLIEQGKLGLDTPVFGLLPHKPHLANGDKVDPRLGQVTIAHLLRHQGGWDRKVTIDPLFHAIEIASVLGKQPPATHDDVIRFMMGWPLDFDPGERYVYSNLGYCLLGRVIEQITGRSYGDYMVKDFLNPIGIVSMCLGKTLLHDRAKNEVKYYPKGELLGIAVTGDAVGSKVSWPYGAWSIESFDSLGGWIASAPDLVRFGSAVDRFEETSILKKKTVEAMFERPAKGHFGNDEKGKPDATYYACGWSVRPRKDGKANRWHTGALSGTSTILVLRHDGLCWAALFNTNQTLDEKRPCKKIDPLIHKAADAVTNWPSHDLFAE